MSMSEKAATDDPATVACLRCKAGWDQIKVIYEGTTPVQLECKACGAKGSRHA